MCGIAGITNFNPNQSIEMETLVGMISYLQHRGPDEYGIYRSQSCGMISARLSIIDLAGGQQPISNEDQSMWIVFNGEIFNYIELKQDLDNKGHQFRTHSDTEVILHLVEEYGVEAVNKLNGQFAFAIWNEKSRELLIARDRFGIRPLFYQWKNNTCLFASEVKAFFAVDSWQAEIDPGVLNQIFTYWAPLSPNTIFQDVYELPPAHYMIIKDGQRRISRYWNMDFSSRQSNRSDESYLEEFEEQLTQAAKIRLRADVEVGAYLSGGLDSSTTTAIIQNLSLSPVETFSIQFSHPDYDEREFQDAFTKSLGVNHHQITCTNEEIGAIFPEVIWHTETPILRTSPAPMFLLSKLVRQNKYKVVLTGEGADEILGGYDIFKEDKIRRFVAQDPASLKRPALFRALYPEIAQLRNANYLSSFFGKNIEDTAANFYTHHIRWSNTARINRFLQTQPPHQYTPYDYPIEVDENFSNWSPLARMQYLEINTFMSSYLMSSQGDRMAMANSVEGRYPFLDVNFVKFANSLPDHLKLRGLQEKWVLRHTAKKWLPKEIWLRRKKPYRAPILKSFINDHPDNDYVNALFSQESLKQTPLLNGFAVNKLWEKAQTNGQLSEVEEMALVGILSTLLINRFFVEKKHPQPKPINRENLLIIDR